MSPRPYVPAAKAAVIGPAAKAPVRPGSSRKLIAAEHKHKQAVAALAAALTRHERARTAADAIGWSTPYGESIKRRAEELGAERCLKAAKAAVKRAESALIRLGGGVVEK